MLNLIVFGGPGSGKGTQSARIIDDFGLYHISTGEVLRDHIKRGTELGKTADSFISKGQLIPDDLMISILEETLDREAKGKRGVIFDGFPRTVAQAEALTELLQKRGTDIRAVIGLEVPDDELTKRMIKRGQDTGRADDNPETIAKRLEVYHNQTQPLKEHYTKLDKYIPIDGTGHVEDVYDKIKQEIKKKSGHEPYKK